MPKKHYKILIPRSVEISLEQQIDYITHEQHSPTIALEWLEGLVGAIESLAEFPDRCAIAPENFHIRSGSKFVIRHLIYKKTFRVIFVVIKNEVRILSVKHAARKRL